MNWDRMEGEWKQRRGKALHHRGKVMNDDLAAIAGKYEELVGRLQGRNGIAKEEADQQIRDFKKTIDRPKKPNNQLIRLKKSLLRRETVGRKRVNSRNHPVNSSPKRSSS